MLVKELIKTLQQVDPTEWWYGEYDIDNKAREKAAVLLRRNSQ